MPETRDARELARCEFRLQYSLPDTPVNVLEITSNFTIKNIESKYLTPWEISPRFHFAARSYIPILQIGASPNCAKFRAVRCSRKPTAFAIPATALMRLRTTAGAAASDSSRNLARFADFGRAWDLPPVPTLASGQRSAYKVPQR